MGIVILVGIFCFGWFLIKMVGGNSDGANPPTTRQYQESLKRKESSSQEHRNVVYKIPRDRLLKLLGWADTPRKYFVGENSIELDVLKGYTYKPIVGTFYRPDVTIFDVGWFNGYAVVEPTNYYDEFAVAIYRDDHKQLGYIPKGDITTFHYIHDQGGYVHAYGALAYDCWSDKWYGFVAIENDASKILHRNLLFENQNITFYEPAINITEFLNEKQNK